mmetsp:Transcript_12717/g.30428  ORF Transcript_12717/g.30428 Transcript_12717/m.30428 type:complete len:264 (+) Transcript_12717:49-840(+)
MNNWNVSNLDVAAQKTLFEVLKPKHYGSIAPVLMTASDADKRSIAKLSKIIHPEASNVPRLNQAVQQNPLGLSCRASSAPRTIDRSQMDVHTGAPPSREHFARYDPMHSSDSVKRYFLLNTERVSSQPFSSLLQKSAMKAMERWQVEQGNDAERAELVSSLRRIQLMRDRLPQYSNDRGSVSESLYNSSRRKQGLHRDILEQAAAERESRFLASMPPPSYAQPGEMSEFERNKEKSTKTSIAFQGKSSGAMTTYQRFHGQAMT